MTRPNTPAALMVALVAATVSLFPATSVHAATPATASPDYARLGAPGTVTVPILSNDTVPEGTTVSLLTYGDDGMGNLSQVLSGPGWQATLTADNQVTIETTTALSTDLRYLVVSYVLRAPGSGASASVGVTIDQPTNGTDDTGDPTESQVRYTVGDSVHLTTTVPGKRARLKDGMHRDGTHHSQALTDALAVPSRPAEARASKIAAAALGEWWTNGARVARGVPVGIYAWRVQWQRQITVVRPDGTSERKPVLRTNSRVRVRVTRTGRVRVLESSLVAATLR